MKLKKTSLLFSCLALFSTASMGAINVYMSPNDIESAEDSLVLGVTTETFNSAGLGILTNYVGTVGNYDSINKVRATGIYGGYQEGNYLELLPNQTTTLTLSGDMEYFGLYFTAANAGNTIELFDNGGSVFSFDTADLLSLLNGGVGQVQAINGNYYNTADYFGKPVTNGNPTQPYAYVHFFASGGSKFDQVKLTENGPSSLDNDNHSVKAVAPAIPPSLVGVPEPSTALLGLLGAVSMFVRRRR